MRSAVVVPVKSFSRAKARLASVLDERARADLARSMAERVLAAAGSLPVLVACDDDEVADWARGHGAEVVWVPGTDLNGAVTAAYEVCAARGVTRVTVAHADLPRARDLSLVVGTSGIVIVPDRRDDGTNVLTVPSSIGFPFAYGPGSFRRHLDIAATMGVPVVVVRPPELTWDVDEPDDLAHPTESPCA
jgi:2-phospho-L-lactate/phosphoenolpyruvate guanylyltransferase